jgi:hypothetical protein
MTGPAMTGPAMTGPAMTGPATREPATPGPAIFFSRGVLYFVAGFLAEVGLVRAAGAAEVSQEIRRSRSPQRDLSLRASL